MKVGNALTVISTQGTTHVLEDSYAPPQNTILLPTSVSIPQTPVYHPLTSGPRFQSLHHQRDTHHCIISCHTHNPMVIGWHGQEMLHNLFSLEVSLRMVLSMRKWCSSLSDLQRCMTGRETLTCPQAVQKVLHQGRGGNAGVSWDPRLILWMNPVNLHMAGKGTMSRRWDIRKRREVDIILEGRGMRTLTAAVRTVVQTVTERRPARWVTVAPHFPNCKPLMAGLRTGSLSSSSLRTWLAAVDGVWLRSWRVCNHVSVANLSRLYAAAQRRWKGVNVAGQSIGRTLWCQGTPWCC